MEKGSLDLNCASVTYKWCGHAMLLTFLTVLMFSFVKYRLKIGLNYNVVVIIRVSKSILEQLDSACSVGDSLCSIPGLGQSPGEGNGNPFQYSCLDNSSEREA